jgi:lipopolysaccharide export system permease protein
VGAFFYQDKALPKIQTKFYSLLISIRQASPALDVPEQVFYKEIDGYNLYVEEKDHETGMLYDVLIYDVGSGFNDMTAIVCDSAEMSMTEDKTMLIFTMHHGQQFRNFTEGEVNPRRRKEFVPYSRENFTMKTMMVAYDANFNRMDEEVIEGSSTSNYVSKNLAQLGASIDSMRTILDSVNIVDRKTMKNYSYLSFRNTYPEEERDSLIASAISAEVEVPLPDTLVQSKPLHEQSSILNSAFMKADNNSNEFLFRSINKTTTRKTINRHWIEWHRKFTIPFTCLIFFFIGAPLGSIVRKGGLGTPIVISVILFIIYYILDNVGYKMTRDGVWAHWFGMWFSSFILLPMGVFLTHKAINDSVILNADTYVNFFKRLLFIREKRDYPMKSVVIDHPEYKRISADLTKLSEEISTFLERYSPVSYKAYWTDEGYDQGLQSIRNSLEASMSQLSNSRRREVLSKAEEFPVLTYQVQPFKANSTLARACMYLFPLGLLLRLISVPIEVRTVNDLRSVQRLCGELIERIRYGEETAQIAIA